MLLASSGMLPDDLCILQKLRTFTLEIMSGAAGWLATCQPERAECSRSPILQRYLHGPGTGITNLPSFSATKFSLVLDELPLPSFFSTLMTSFLVGLSGKQTFPPPGESIGVDAFFTSSEVRFTSSMLA